MKYVSNISNVFCSLVWNVNLSFHVEDFIPLKISTQEKFGYLQQLSSIKCIILCPAHTTPMGWLISNRHKKNKTWIV